MILNIRVSDTSRYDFVYKQNFWISDISNCIIDIINSINEVSKWFKDINKSIFGITISISDIL